MSQQQEMADLLYGRLSQGPIPVARLIGEVAKRWGDAHSAGSVNFFVREVAGDLLRRDDVDVGDIRDGKFLSWTLHPWEANDVIGGELENTQELFEDQTRIVFQIKKPNHSPDPTPTAGTPPAGQESRHA